MGDRLFSAQIVKNNMKSLIFLNFTIFLISSLVTAGDFVYDGRYTSLQGYDVC